MLVLLPIGTRFTVPHTRQEKARGFQRGDIVEGPAGRPQGPAPTIHGWRSPEIVYSRGGACPRPAGHATAFLLFRRQDGAKQRAFDGSGGGTLRAEHSRAGGVFCR